jgi:dolichol kinase
VSLLHEPGARPLKWGRIGLHLGGGLLAAELMLRESLPISWRQFTYIFASLVVGVDLLRFTVPSINRRIIDHLGWFAQNHESKRITSASWFWIAMSVIASITEREFYLATLVTLSVGDPAGSIIGRKVSSPVLVHGRTVAGTSAFFVSAAVLSTLTLSRLGFSADHVGFVLLVVGASSLGAVLELYASKIDDNLAIGLGVGLFYTLVGPVVL